MARATRTTSSPSPAAPAGGAAPVIPARGLRKQYGDFHAVQGIDLEVRPGECFGLLGPNGAGKSTAMRMLAGTSQRTGGELRILGIDPEEDGPAVRARLGVVPQQDNLDEDLTARENILIYGRYFGLPYSCLRPKAEELLAFAQLTDKADAKVTDLSGGMKRRLVIARALVNEPALFLLDEPTTGLDPQARHILWDRLYRLKEHADTLQQDLARLVAEGHVTAPVTQLTRRASLEDVFLILTGRTLVD